MAAGCGWPPNTGLSEPMPMGGKELKAFLEEIRLCHWATVDPEGRPRVRPLWYLYADRAFWFTTRLELRHTGADVAAGSPVAVSIASEERPYRAVIAHGTPEVWTEDRDRWLERIATRYGLSSARGGERHPPLPRGGQPDPGGPASGRDGSRMPGRGPGPVPHRRSRHRPSGARRVDGGRGPGPG